MITVNRSNGTSFTINDGETVGPVNWPVSHSKLSKPVEIVAITSSTFKVYGDYSYRLVNAFSITVQNAGSNNGTYTLSANSTFDGTYTTATISTTFADLTQRGQITYQVPGSEVQNTLTLSGRGGVDIAMYVAQNMTNLVENFANTVAPPNPVTGQLWFNTTANELQIYDNTSTFVNVSGNSSSESANTVLAGPTSGSAAAPTFRTLVAADLPTSVVQSIAITTDAILYPSTVSFTVTAGAASGSLTLSAQPQNYVFAGPTTGGMGTPGFRALVGTDLPLATTLAVGGVSISTGLAVSSGAVSIATNGVTNSMLAQMTTLTLKGNNTGSTANATDLNAAQVTAMLSTFSATQQGVVPASGGSSTQYLSGAGTWTTPAATALLSSANVWTNIQSFKPVRATISGAVTVDLSNLSASTNVTPTGSNPTASNKLNLTLTGNVSSFALANPIDGTDYEIRFIQDGTGGHTMPSLPSTIKFSGGTAPTFTTSANAVDFLSLSYGATEATYMGAFLANMS